MYLSKTGLKEKNPKLQMSRASRSRQPRGATGPSPVFPGRLREATNALQTDTCAAQTLSPGYKASPRRPQSLLSRPLLWRLSFWAKAQQCHSFGLVGQGDRKEPEEADMFLQPETRLPEVGITKRFGLPAVRREAHSECVGGASIPSSRIPT